ncbi:MAG TPA: hypothetical protein VKU87_04810, partial [Thermomicrobiaceae bacterium]|nr:hypothetical protein [Thermomicrobiaceae bacterium]
MATNTAGRTFAIIDIGSNSGRLAVLRATPGGHLETIEEGRAPLRLAADLDDEGNLPDAAIERVAAAVADFRAIAAAFEGIETRVYATAAVRDAPNRTGFVAQVEQRTGLAVEVLSAEQEAQYSFLGTLRGMPTEHGYTLDIGGGSLEISHFRGRHLHGSRTLSLGALRLSRDF